MMPSSFAPKHLALLSLVSAGLTLISFCIGVIPIPLTAWVCYPAALVLGGVAMGTGLVALRRADKSDPQVRNMALPGIWIGLLSIVAVMCFTVLTVLLFSYGAETLYNLWLQYKP